MSAPEQYHYQGPTLEDAQRFNNAHPVLQQRQVQTDLMGHAQESRSPAGNDLLETDTLNLKQ